MKHKDSGKIHRFRLSRRNLLERLNETIQLLSERLPEAANIPIVKTAKDLRALPVKLKALGTVRSPVSMLAPEPPPEAVKNSNRHEHALATVATNAWRAKSRMIDPSTGEEIESMRRVSRHIDGIIDALWEANLAIEDPLGRAYDAGMPFRVISFEPTPGISRDEVTETIKPGIRLDGRLVQQAEVIVGIPERG